MEKIGNILKIVETVDLLDCTQEGCILKYCQHLKYLRIIHGSLLNRTDGFGALAGVKLPNLELLECCLYGRKDATQLEIFLELSPNVKRLVVRILFISMSITVATINQIAVSSSNIEELFLNVNHEAIDFDYDCIYNEMKLFEKRKHFKRLEFEISYGSSLINVIKLAELKSFTGLHLERQTADLSAISSFVNLTILELRSTHIKVELITKIAQNLTKLSEFYLTNCLPVNVMSYLKPFACYSRSLIKFFIWVSPRLTRFRDGEMQQLIDLRGSLIGARKMTIYIEQGVEDVSVIQSGNEECDELVACKSISFANAP